MFQECLLPLGPIRHPSRGLSGQLRPIPICKGVTEKTAEMKTPSWSLHVSYRLVFTTKVGHKIFWGHIKNWTSHITLPGQPLLTWASAHVLQR